MAQKADADLWKVYGNKLMAAATLGGMGSGRRLYIAPLSSVGIAAGNKIPQTITNKGIYTVGDSLLDVNSPVMVPSLSGYFDRCVLYSQSIDPGANADLGAKSRLDTAQTAAMNAQAQFIKTKMAAQAQYDKEAAAKMTSDSFAIWVASNWPSYASDEAANTAAAFDLTSKMADVKGPEAAQVGKFQSQMQLAGSTNPAPGLNMACSSAPANVIASLDNSPVPTTYLRPEYDIDSSYPQICQGWIETYPQKSKNPIKIDFSVSETSSKSWSSLGFDDTSVQISAPIFLFFTATYTENDQTVTKQISTQDAGSQLSASLTCTGLQTFKITPGNWNPGFMFGMNLKDSAPASLLQPAAVVTQVLVGYGVGLSISLSAELCNQVHDYISKAKSTNGYASIFGFNIGLGGNGNVNNTSTTTFDDVLNASAGSAINIPGNDNGYPTILAVIGEDLKQPANHAS